MMMNRNKWDILFCIYPNDKGSFSTSCNDSVVSSMFSFSRLCRYALLPVSASNNSASPIDYEAIFAVNGREYKKIRNNSNNKARSGFIPILPKSTVLGRNNQTYQQNTHPHLDQQNIPEFVEILLPTTTYITYFKHPSVLKNESPLNYGITFPISSNVFNKDLDSDNIITLYKWSNDFKNIKEGESANISNEVNSTSVTTVNDSVVNVNSVVPEVAYQSESFYSSTTPSDCSELQSDAFIDESSENLNSIKRPTDVVETSFYEDLFSPIIADTASTSEVTSYDPSPENITEERDEIIEEDETNAQYESMFEFMNWDEFDFLSPKVDYLVPSPQLPAETDSMMISTIFSEAGFHYYLETPTSILTPKSDDRVSYIDKGQYYTVTLEYVYDELRPLPNRNVTSVIALVFSGENDSLNEVNKWIKWYERENKNKNVLVAAENNVGIIGEVVELSNNSLLFTWCPLESKVQINIAVNCSSSEFHVPGTTTETSFHLQIDTFCSLLQEAIPYHRAYCQIKSYNMKAEEKLQDENFNYILQSLEYECAPPHPGMIDVKSLYHSPCERYHFNEMKDTKKKLLHYTPTLVDDLHDNNSQTMKRKNMGCFEDESSPEENDFNCWYEDFMYNSAPTPKRIKLYHTEEDMCMQVYNET